MSQRMTDGNFDSPLLVPYGSPNGLDFNSYIHVSEWILLAGGLEASELPLRE